MSTPETVAWMMHGLAVRILRDVSRHCAEAGIPFLPVKGVVTSRTLYQDEAERPISDVDIRIQPRDFGAFRNLALEAGWTCSRVARTYGNLVYAFPPLSLDVESHVGPPGMCALRIEDMIARAERLQLSEGLEVAVPEIHDHALLLTINAFKDKITGAVPAALEDLVRVVVHQDFRPEVFAERAVEVRSATMAWVVAVWLEERGNDAWAQLRIRLEKLGIRRGYTRRFRKLAGGADGGILAGRLLTRAGADDALMRAQAVGTSVAWELEMWLRYRRPITSLLRRYRAPPPPRSE